KSAICIAASSRADSTLENFGFATTEREVTMAFVLLSTSVASQETLELLRPYQPQPPAFFTSRMTTFKVTSVVPSSLESLYSAKDSCSLSLTMSWVSMRPVSSFPRSFGSSAVHSNFTDLYVPSGPAGSWLTLRVGPLPPQAAPTIAATTNTTMRADVGPTRGRIDFMARILR